MQHTIFGLHRLNLIEGATPYGSVETVKPYYPEAKTQGILFSPSVVGVELYLWAHGHSNVTASKFLDEETQFADSEILTIPDGVIPTQL